ncbi:MAG TPA: arsenate reductase, partial [Saprospiraceae bacterium]|nr:arsenate reductase [Saprospiraceae bacterium]
MNNKIYHLSSCSTCVKILGCLNDKSGIELINIKEKNISAKDLDYAAKIVGSYEQLFSRRALKFRSMGLHEQV